MAEATPKTICETGLSVTYSYPCWIIILFGVKTSNDAGLEVINYCSNNNQPPKNGPFLPLFYPPFSRLLSKKGVKFVGADVRDNCVHFTHSHCLPVPPGYVRAYLGLLLPVLRLPLLLLLPFLHGGGLHTPD